MKRTGAGFACLFALAAFFVLLAGCGEPQPDIKEAVYGKWIVTEMTYGSDTVNPQDAGIEASFEFREDGVLDVMQNGKLTGAGSWDYDGESVTVTTDSGENGTGFFSEGEIRFENFSQTDYSFTLKKEISQ